MKNKPIKQSNASILLCYNFYLKAYLLRFADKQQNPWLETAGGFLFGMMEQWNAGILGMGSWNDGFIESYLPTVYLFASFEEI